MAVFPWGMKQRRMTSDEWTAEDPVLEDGEIGFETDTGLSKTGRGNIVWTNLDYDQDWENITNRPSTFPPESHDHDDIYKRESDIDADHYTKHDWNQAMIGSPWDSGRTYASGDTVAHQGVYWVSQQDNNTVEPGTDTNYWQQYHSPSGDLTTLVEAPAGDNLTYKVSDGGEHRFEGDVEIDGNLQALNKWVQSFGTPGTIENGPYYFDIKTKSGENIIDYVRNNSVQSFHGLVYITDSYNVHQLRVFTLQVHYNDRDYSGYANWESISFLKSNSSSSDYTRTDLVENNGVLQLKVNEHTGDHTSYTKDTHTFWVTMDGMYK